MYLFLWLTDMNEFFRFPCISMFFIVFHCSQKKEVDRTVQCIVNIAEAVFLHVAFI